MSSASGWVRALAPSKVNLWLDVRGRRSDGYRDLDTGLLALELADVVEARVSDRAGVRLELGGPFASADIPADGRNLAWRAARACLDALGERRGLELRLAKHVPSRAGLGAGSADAAAALVACEAALGRTLSETRAEAILADLGSDCVFFRAARATGFARCSGRGDVVQPLPPPPPGWIVALIVPDLGASTAEVYAALGQPLRDAPRVPTVRTNLLHLEEPAARGALANGLEQAALVAVEGLAPWRAMLADCGAAHFRLCGSGSSYFGLYRDSDEAARCLTSLAETARARALVPRALLLTRPSGRGARLVPVTAGGG